ncbi:MAG: hypothetical protein JWO78_2470 [Micavibrio sp.]|nr:hypothetical protein [Micavibrio sp.]
MSDRTLQTIFLQAARNQVRGYGEQTREILTVNADDPDSVSLAIRRFKSPEAGALLINDHSKAGKLREALDWIGAHSPRMIIPVGLNNVGELEDKIRGQLSLHTKTNETCPELKERACIVTSQVKSDLHQLSPVFDLTDGFNVDFVTSSHRNPQWHIDFALDGVPYAGFVRAVRCAHEKSTLIAFREHTDRIRVNNTSRYEVSRCAGGGSGLVVLKGSTVHASPATDVQRTIYRITPRRAIPV